MPHDRPYTDSELFAAINGSARAYPIKPWSPTPSVRDFVSSEAKKAAEARRLEVKRQEEAKKAAEEEERRKKAALLAQAEQAQAENETEQLKNGQANPFQAIQNFLKNNMQDFAQILNYLKTWEQQSEQTFKDRNIIDGKPHTGGFGSALGKLLGVFSKIFEFIFGFIQSWTGNPASLVAGLTNNPTGPTSKAAPSIAPTGPRGPVPSAPRGPEPVAPRGPVPTTAGPLQPVQPGLFFSKAGKSASNGPSLKGKGPKGMGPSIKGLDQDLGYEPRKTDGKPVPTIRL